MKYSYSATLKFSVNPMHRYFQVPKRVLEHVYGAEEDGEGEEFEDEFEDDEEEEELVNGDFAGSTAEAAPADSGSAGAGASPGSQLAVAYAEDGTADNGAQQHS